MCLLLLLFRCHEKNGGLIYEQLRSKLWAKIIKQSKNGPKGREETPGGQNPDILPPRSGYREGEELQQATALQTELLEYIELVNRNIKTVDPRTPRYLQFEMLLQYAINFGLGRISGEIEKNVEEHVEKENYVKENLVRKENLVKKNRYIIYG